MNSPPPPPPPNPKTTVAAREILINTESFFKNSGALGNLPECSVNGLIREHLKVEGIERGRITCLVTVTLPISNEYGSFHGGAVAATAELVALACAKTLVENDLFLGELSISYLSAARVNEELEVSGFIVRQGRNVTVTSVDFRVKETKKLVYTARATLYNVPIAKL